MQVPGRVCFKCDVAILQERRALGPEHSRVGDRSTKEP